MKSLITKDKLLKHEYALLYRLRTGLTQEEFAKKLNISIDRLKKIEAGTGHADLRKIKFPLDGKITAQEMCLIRRRRAGMKQSELAKKLGVCRYWLIKMEQGEADVSKLYKFWLNEQSA